MEQQTSTAAGKSGPLAARVTKLRDALAALDKALHIATTYSAEHEVARRFRADLVAKVQAAAEEGELWLDVRAKALLLAAQEVYREDPAGDGFVFRLYRDGIRRLGLLPGITAAEVEGLAHALWVPLDTPEHFDANIVTLLGELELAHLRYVVVELIAENPLQGEELTVAQELMDHIITAATSDKLPPSEPVQPSPHLVRISTQALAQLTPEHIAATVAMADESGSVEVFGGEEQTSWRAALHAQLEDRELISKFVELICQGLDAGDAAREPALLQTLNLLANWLVAGGRGAACLELIRCVQCMARPGNELLQRVLQPAQIEYLIAAACRGEVDHAELLQVLGYVPAERQGEIVAACLKLAAQQTHEGLVQLLCSLLSSRPELLSPALRAADARENHLACDALLAMGTPAAYEALAPLATHDDPRWRLEFLRSTAEVKEAAVRAARTALLEDNNGRVRALAEQIELRHDARRLVARLQQRLACGAVLQLPLAEKRRICEILSAHGGPAAIHALKQLLGQGGIFRRQQQLELCIAAAYGLAASGDLRYLPLLEAEADRRLTARAVRAACKEAAALLGSGRVAEKLVAPSSTEEPEGKQASAAEAEDMQPVTATPQAASMPLEPSSGPELGRWLELEETAVAPLECGASAEQAGPGAWHEFDPRAIALEEGAPLESDSGGTELVLDEPHGAMSSPGPETASSRARLPTGVEEMVRAYLDEQSAAPLERPGARETQPRERSRGKPSAANGVDDLLRQYLEEDKLR